MRRGARRAAVLATVLAAAGTVGGAASAQQPLGGYGVTAIAAPVSVLVYTNGIPLPPPQGELHLSFTRTEMETGPSDRALSSTLWPGDALGTEWGLITQTGKPYPVQANASYPGGPAKQHASQLPGVNEDAAANVGAATATSTMGEFPASAPSQVVTIGHMTSTSTVTNTGTTVTAAAMSAAQDISLLGGVVRIQYVGSSATAGSDGVKGSAGDDERVTGLTVAGHSFTVDEHGVHPGPAPSVPIPGLPSQGEALLHQLGIQLFGPGAIRQVKASTGTIGSHALEVSVDTATYYNALNKLPWSSLLQIVPDKVWSALCVPLPKQIPLGTAVCARDELFYALSLSPKLVFVLGDVTAAASGAPGFPPFTASLPPATTVGGTHATAPVSAPLPGSSLGGSTTPTSTGQAPQVAGSVPAALATPSFSGVPVWLVLLGLAVAGAVGFLLYRYGWGLLPGITGGAGCDLGARGGVPDLRSG